MGTDDTNKETHDSQSPSASATDTDSAARRAGGKDDGHPSPQEQAATEALAKELAHAPAEGDASPDVPDGGTKGSDSEAGSDGKDSGSTKQATTTSSGDQERAGDGKAAGSDDGQDGPPKLTAKQAEALKHFGVDPEDVLAMGQDGIRLAEKLAKARSDVSRMASEKGQLDAQLKALREKTATNRTQQDETSGERDESQAGEQDGDKLAQLDASDWFDDEQVAGKLNRNFELLNRSISAIAERLNGLDQSSQHETERHETALHDEFFDSLNKQDWESTFGRGAMSTLAEDSTEAANRARVVEAYNAIMDLAEQRGHSVTPKDAMRRALAAEFPDEFEKAAQRSASDAARRRRRGASEQPTGRRKAAPPVDAQADATEQLAKDLASLYE